MANPNDKQNRKNDPDFNQGQYPNQRPDLPQSPNQPQRTQDQNRPIERPGQAPRHEPRQDEPRRGGNREDLDLDGKSGRTPDRR